MGNKLVLFATAVFILAIITIFTFYASPTSQNLLKKPCFKGQCTSTYPTTSVASTTASASSTISSIQSTTIITTVSPTTTILQAHGSDFFGVNTHNVSFYSSIIQPSGAGWIRIPVYSTVSSYLSDAKQKGLNTLVILDDMSVWYYTGMDLVPNLQTWNQTVTDFVKQYGSEVNAYEIWNEPTYFTNGYQNGSPQNYYNLLCSAYKIIKQYEPGAIVVGLGGMNLYTGGNTTRLNTDLAFAKQVANLGGAQCMDAISIHAYDWGYQGGWVWQNWTTNMQAYQNDFPGKPAWVTETGATISDLGGNQTTFINDGFSTLIDSNASEIFWYLFEEDGKGFGLVNGSTPRNSYYTFQQFTNGTQQGQLRVTTSPAAGAQFYIDNNFVSNWSINWPYYASGQHTLKSIYNSNTYTWPIQIETGQDLVMVVNAINGNIISSQYVCCVEPIK